MIWPSMTIGCPCTRWVRPLGRVRSTRCGLNWRANPVMRWNVENVAVKTDESGRIRPVKPKRAAKRIDGVVATLMGLNRLIANPDQRSVYEDRGITFL